MRLADYIKTPEHRSAFASALGVTVEAVRYWEKGARTPRPGTMRRIMELTARQVTPMDFLGASERAA